MLLLFDQLKPWGKPPSTEVIEHDEAKKGTPDSSHDPNYHPSPPMFEPHNGPNNPDPYPGGGKSLGCFGTCFFFFFAPDTTERRRQPPLTDFFSFKLLSLSKLLFSPVSSKHSKSMTSTLPPVSTMLPVPESTCVILRPT
jgi:hypothetical protein